MTNFYKDRALLGNKQYNKFVRPSSVATLRWSAIYPWGAKYAMRGTRIHCNLIHPYTHTRCTIMQKKDIMFSSSVCRLVWMYLYTRNAQVYLYMRTGKRKEIHYFVECKVYIGFVRKVKLLENHRINIEKWDLAKLYSLNLLAPISIIYILLLK